MHIITRRLLQHTRRYFQGSTLIEVLIATVVVGLIVTAIASTLTQSLKNNSEAQYRQVATRLAQDGLELFAQYKATSTWGVFSGTPSITSAGKKHCLDQTTVAALASAQEKLTGEACSTVAVPGVNTNFQRSFIKSAAGASGVKIQVKVSWTDGTATRDVDLQQTFYNY